jgi:hypothetical protein
MWIRFKAFLSSSSGEFRNATVSRETKPSGKSKTRHFELENKRAISVAIGRGGMTMSSSRRVVLVQSQASGPPIAPEHIRIGERDVVQSTPEQVGQIVAASDVAAVVIHAPEHGLSRHDCLAIVRQVRAETATTAIVVLSNDGLLDDQTLSEAGGDLLVPLPCSADVARHEIRRAIAGRRRRLFGADATVTRSPLRSDPKK